MRRAVVVTLVVLLVLLVGAPAFGVTTGPSVTVTPHTGLTDGAPVTVTGSGFVPGSLVTVTICGTAVVSDPTLATFFASCYFSDFTNVTNDAAGGFVTGFTVATTGTTIFGGPAPNCGVSPGDCVIAAANFDTGQFASAPITFGFPTPTSTADCRHGGWRNFYDSNGRPFRNQGGCVSWAIRHHRS